MALSHKKLAQKRHRAKQKRKDKTYNPAKRWIQVAELPRKTPDAQETLTL